jgi:hypothetical protein
LVFYVVLEDTIEIHRIINSKMDIKRIIKWYDPSNTCVWGIFS